MEFSGAGAGAGSRSRSRKLLIISAPAPAPAKKAGSGRLRLRLRLRLRNTVKKTWKIKDQRPEYLETWSVAMYLEGTFKISDSGEIQP